MNIPAIRLEGAPNFRDFGGYRTADGRFVRRGQLFRSDTLSVLTAQDFKKMASLGLRLVCDLRSSAEREHKPTHWPEGFRPKALHMGINADLRAGDEGLLDSLRRDATGHGAATMMLSIYRMIPHAARHHLHALFNHLANDDMLPLVIHCSAGKDRTGVLTALIQLALGVSRDDALADYLLTACYHDAAAFEAIVAEATEHALGIAPPREVVLTLASVRESYLDAALRTIDDDHGSLENYLASAGIDSALLARVRERLLE